MFLVIHAPATLKCCWISPIIIIANTVYRKIIVQNTSYTAHLFQGSPDITIKKHDHEEIAHVVMQQSEDDGNGSDSDSSKKH